MQYLQLYFRIFKSFLLLYRLFPLRYVALCPAPPPCMCLWVCVCVCVSVLFFIFKAFPKRLVILHWPLIFKHGALKSSWVWFVEYRFYHEMILLGHLTGDLQFLKLMRFLPKKTLLISRLQGTWAWLTMFWEMTWWKELWVSTFITSTCTRSVFRKVPHLPLCLTSVIPEKLSFTITRE